VPEAEPEKEEPARLLHLACREKPSLLPPLPPLQPPSSRGAVGSTVTISMAPLLVLSAAVRSSSSGCTAASSAERGTASREEPELLLEPASAPPPAPPPARGNFFSGLRWRAGEEREGGESAAVAAAQSAAASAPAFALHIVGLRELVLCLGAAAAVAIDGGGQPLRLGTCLSLLLSEVGVAQGAQSLCCKMQVSPGAKRGFD
jgi:hypothetical protein